MRLFTLAASSSLQAAPGGGCSPRAVAAARGTVQGGMAGAADVLSSKFHLGYNMLLNCVLQLFLERLGVLRLPTLLREVHVLRRYLIQDREDYHSYNKLVGLVTKLVTLLKKLDERDAVRVEVTDLLLDKLHGLGVIQKKRLSACDRIAASALCRRRLQ